MTKDRHLGTRALVNSCGHDKEPHCCHICGVFREHFLPGGHRNGAQAEIHSAQGEGGWSLGRPEQVGMGGEHPQETEPRRGWGLRKWAWKGPSDLWRSQDLNSSVWEKPVWRAGRATQRVSRATAVRTELESPVHHVFH